MNWVLLRNSLFVGSLTTILSVTLGFFAAVWLAALPTRLRPWFFAAAVGAFALPPFLVTNCWLHYLGQVGVWHTWLPFDLFFSRWHNLGAQSATLAVELFSDLGCVATPRSGSVGK